MLESQDEDSKDKKKDTQASEGGEEEDGVRAAAEGDAKTKQAEADADGKETEMADAEEVLAGAALLSMLVCCLSLNQGQKTTVAASNAGIRTSAVDGYSKLPVTSMATRNTCQCQHLHNSLVSHGCCCTLESILRCQCNKLISWLQAEEAAASEEEHEKLERKATAKEKQKEKDTGKKGKEKEKEKEKDVGKKGKGTKAAAVTPPKESSRRSTRSSRAAKEAEEEQEQVRDRSPAFRVTCFSSHAKCDFMVAF